MFQQCKWSSSLSNSHEICSIKIDVGNEESTSIKLAVRSCSSTLSSWPFSSRHCCHFTPMVLTYPHISCLQGQSGHLHFFIVECTTDATRGLAQIKYSFLNNGGKNHCE